ncbi:epididymal sperm-binding protein 1-like [Dromaius novaehollandiae]|uniref:epididymal sperm-binding protein 1-like n=1 Tax=Dromaius novaehollandiae TaxID=8790 RepID=UPI00311FCE34
MQKLPLRFIFLLWGALVPLCLADTGGEPVPCVFPFIYEGRTYSFCTEDGSSKGTPWCATTSSYDLDGKWKYCTLQEHGGSSGGQPCFFPFIYKNRTFYTCTNEHMEDGQFWCATSDSYDRDRRWSYCADIMLSSNPTGPCIFPFTYKGQTYTSCTTDGALKGLLWCSLSSNYEQDPKWTYCQASVSGTNSGNLPCVFPFQYKAKLYHGCTNIDSQDRRYWCSSTSSYSNQWHYCSTTEYGGNSNGENCVFPFIYKENLFYSCIKTNDSTGNLWCATTGNYDQDKLWSYCPETYVSWNNTESKCVFPFIYMEKLHHSCIQSERLAGKFWCATTSNYDQNKTWTLCSYTGPSHSSEKPCVFPFTYEGLQFNECTSLNESNGKLWCSTTDNYDRDRKWSFCPV